MGEVIRINSEEDFEEYMNENKDWYHRLCYEKIYNNFYGEHADVVEIIVFLIDDNPDTEYVISVDKEDFELNLTYGLAYFEDIEDYEMCTKVNDLIGNINVYNGLSELK